MFLIIIGILWNKICLIQFCVNFSILCKVYRSFFRAFHIYIVINPVKKGTLAMDTYPEYIGNQLTCLIDKELQRVLLQYQKRAGFSSTKEMFLHLKEVALCSHFDYLGQVDESKESSWLLC